MKLYFERLLFIWKQKFVQVTQPSPTITDPIQRQHMRLINSLVLIFIPIAVFGGVLHLILDTSDTPLIYDTTLISVMLPTLFLSAVALSGHFIGYRSATTLMFTVGYGVIMINATFDKPDYFDVSYLILLTVVATIILSIRYVMLLALLQLISIIILVTITSSENSANLIVFSTVGNLVLIITSYYRNLLEHDRNQKLIESEAFLKLITSQLPISVWITDKKFARRATFGRIQEIDQLATMPTNRSMLAYRQALAGESIQFEIHQSERFLQYHIEPMRSHNNEIIGTLGVATDITEQKLSQQHSLQLELERERVQILSQFLEHSSHDLRTPISNINTYLYLLDNTVKTPKEHDYISVIREQSERLQGLIDNMLMLQRLELDVAEDLRKISLNSLLDALHIAYRDRIESHCITFEYLAPHDSITVRAVEKNIFLAISKLLDNAIQFTSAGGTIRMYTTYNHEDVRVSIQDTGIGIPQDQLAHIFEIFYRGDNSRPASKGDNGLGLTIVDRIVKNHRGTVTVDSVVNEGTTFHVTLPIERIRETV